MSENVPCLKDTRQGLESEDSSPQGSEPWSE